jgi:TMEM175 potassium channel family protein
LVPEAAREASLIAFGSNGRSTSATCSLSSTSESVWLNHHSIFSRLRGVGHGLVLLNLLLLLVVSVLPFPTDVLGDTLQNGDFADQRTAALLYAGNFLLASIAFCALWLWASRGRRLIRDEMCDEAIRLRTWRMVIAVPAFSIPFVVAIWSPIAAISIDGAIMISFLLSDGSLERRIGRLNVAVARRLG